MYHYLSVHRITRDPWRGASRPLFLVHARLSALLTALEPFKAGGVAFFLETWEAKAACRCYRTPVPVRALPGTFTSLSISALATTPSTYLYFGTSSLGALYHYCEGGCPQDLVEVNVKDKT